MKIKDNLIIFDNWGQFIRQSVFDDMINQSNAVNASQDEAITKNKEDIKTNAKDIATNKKDIQSGQQTISEILTKLSAGQIEGSVDLNEYTEPRFYEILGANLTNSPIESCWGILYNLAFNSKSNGFQILIDTGGNKIYWRTWQSYNSFNEWQTV